jgi:hypothetical protein
VAYTLRAIQKAFFSGASTGEETVWASVPLAATSTEPGDGAFPFAVAPRDSASAVVELSARAIESGVTTAIGPHDGSQGKAGEQHSFEDISIPERIGAAILIATTLLVGLYPRLLLDLIVPALNSPLLEKVMKGGAR